MPVFFGAVIVAYFSFNVEHEGLVGLICAVTALNTEAYYRHIKAVTIAMLACVLFSAGFANVKFRNDRIEAPVLSKSWDPEFSAAAFYELKPSQNVHVCCWIS
mgnify:CR=1 FL=1